MKALVGAFNQEKALVGAFSVIVQPGVEPMDRFAALVLAAQCRHYPCLNTAPPRSAHNILHTDYSQFVQVVNGETFINI